jgi:m7GpppX diphosphatase
MYLLAIAKNSAIRSLRDLDGNKHLDLLKGIRRAVFEQVPLRYPGISGAQLRCFIHYQPTYYHFHVHVVHVDMVDGIGALVGQAHLLDDVIDNLSNFGADFYQRKTLTYQLGRNHELFEILSTAQVIDL